MKLSLNFEFLHFSPSSSHLLPAGRAAPSTHAAVEEGDEIEINKGGLTVTAAKRTKLPNWLSFELIAAYLSRQTAGSRFGNASKLALWEQAAAQTYPALVLALDSQGYWEAGTKDMKQLEFAWFHCARHSAAGILEYTMG